MTEFNVGDKVKIEGLLVSNSDVHYPLRIYLTTDSYISFTKEGKYHISDENISLQMVEKHVPLENHYKVFMKYHGNDAISADYYKSKEDFEKRNNGLDYEFMQLLESTKVLK